MKITDDAKRIKKRASDAQYRVTHREQLRAALKKYAAHNEQKIKERGRKYYAAHKEKIRAYAAAHKEQRNLRMGKYRVEHPEKQPTPLQAAAYSRKWYASHVEERSAYNKKRYAATKNARQQKIVEQQLEWARVHKLSPSMIRTRGR